MHRSQSIDLDDAGFRREMVRGKEGSSQLSSRQFAKATKKMDATDSLPYYDTDIDRIAGALACDGPMH